jgi:RND family efflux transporter MFP subunit
MSIDRQHPFHGGRRFAVGWLALVLAACGGDSAAESTPTAMAVSVGPENVAVAMTDRIQSGPLISGTLRPEREATIRAEVAGSVLEVYAEPGQAVARGARLARIEDVGVRDAYLSAQSAVRSAENATQVARRNAERSATLAGAGAIADRDVELARNTLAGAQAQLADARARLAQAQRQLDATRVASPIAGVVSARPVNAGDVVAPGAALFTVVDPGSMRLEAAVPSVEVAALRVGAPVEFRIRGYGEQTFTGRIERINPVADPATGQVPIQVSVPSTGNLVAGLFAEGRVAAESRQALVVPADAVDESGARPAVLRIRGGRTERVPVELGIRDSEAERVEVVAGIAAGDTLVTGTARGITPGTPVRVSPAAPAATQP